MSRSWLDAFLGRILDNGTELELLGGVNFVGFAIDADTANGYYTITNAGGTIADNSLALAKLVNATGARVIGATGAGPWGELTGTQVGALVAGPLGAGATPITNITMTGALSGATSGAFSSFVSAGATPATAGELRVPHVSAALFRNNANDNNRYIWRTGATTDDLWLGSADTGCDTTIFAGTTLTLAPGGSAEWNFTASQLDATGGNLVNVGSINGATVAAPTQGTAITTTATINVSSGVKYDVSSAGGAYAITLGTSGTPLDGEMVTLRCTAALANDITVTNGGTGGGNLGPAGKMAAGTKGEYYYYYDGTATAWKYGGYQRCQ